MVVNVLVRLVINSDARSHWIGRAEDGYDSYLNC